MLRVRLKNNLTMTSQQVFDRRSNFECTVLHKDNGLEAVESFSGILRLPARSSKPVTGNGFVKFTVDEKRLDNVVVVGSRVIRLVLLKVNGFSRVRGKYEVNLPCVACNGL